MNEQPSNQEVVKTPEKTADEFFREMMQAFEEVYKLEEQIYELEMKKMGDDLTKEEQLAIATECKTLLIQLGEKREFEKKLYAQWEKAEEDKAAESEEELKSLEEEIKNLEKEIKN